MSTLKLQIVQDSDEKNATFIFENEDHTLGNPLRYVLSKHPDVSFVGYSVPHPYEEKMHLRIQTKSKPARDVLKEATNTLEEMMTTLKGKMEDALREAEIS
ncbi:putative DNA-directed RNA polymerases I and III 16 kDa polypeptide [Blattamonas nauphoetae]|uniref:DNA-directed RNA polymerases I and III 16 kDa polypeptide n=1 Tax=Blattamonas nauphoetae TaxID=2049346 RepID=A0ABQ9Y3Z3_9EUKA|nr:putative DNA-directed RNA polymerases I and III 16 kDa polypeptide [Blattamonas nauphoetae]